MTRSARSARAPVDHDLIPLDEVAARLQQAPKTIRRLHRVKGLPLVRFTGGGPYFAIWSDVIAWARARAQAPHG